MGSALDAATRFVRNFSGYSRSWPSLREFGNTECLDYFLRDVPRHRQRQPFADALRGRVAQQTLRFADVGQAVAHVAGTEVAVNGLGALKVRVKR